MKSIFLKLTLVVALIIGCGVARADEHNVSPQSLPVKVKTFLATYFMQATVNEAEVKHGIYEIELSNGYDVKINEAGQWLKIEAPSHKMIPLNVLNVFLPKKVVSHLTQKGVQSKVDEIYFYPESGYKVEIEGAMNDIYFTKAGDLK